MIKKIVPLFSVPVLYIFESDYKLSCLELSVLNSLKESDNISRVSEEKFVLENPELKNLKLFLQNSIDEYAKEVCGVSDKFYITNSWTTRNKTGTGHHRHNHPNSIFSGVYYVSAHENTAPLALHSETPIFKKFSLEYHFKDYNLFNSNDWTFSVKSGSLIIFPSWVDHSSSVNESFEDRRILGFNTFVKGKFGDYNYCSDLEIL